MVTRVFDILVNNQSLLLFGGALRTMYIYSIDIFSHATLILDHELIDGFKRELGLGLCNERLPLHMI